jgi:hypothetical protein
VTRAIHHSSRDGTPHEPLRLGDAPALGTGGFMSVTFPRRVRSARGRAGDEPVPVPRESEPAVVYLSAEQSTFGSLRYRRAICRVSEVWPRAALMDVHSCGFVSRTDWELRWPFICDGIDSLVVLPAADASIGEQTWRELHDALGAGLSCWFVTDTNRLAGFQSVRLEPYPEVDRTVRRWALVEVRAGTS